MTKAGQKQRDLGMPYMRLKYVLGWVLAKNSRTSSLFHLKCLLYATLGQDGYSSPRVLDSENCVKSKMDLEVQ